MEVIKQHPLLLITQENVAHGRSFYAENDGQRINESLDAILEWMKKQPHLAESSKHVSRDYLERLFLLARGSIEGAKEKVDKLFAMRGMVPEICLNRTPGEFDKLLTCLRIVPLPKLIPKENSRVVITQVINKNIDDASLLAYCRYGNMIGELRMYFDYNDGDRFVLDLNGVSLLSKMNPMLMKKFDLLGSTYSTRVKGFHIVNAPPYIDALVNLFKSTMRAKVASRTHVHSSYEELQQHIPKEVLPEDFGGDEAPMAELAERWKEYLNSPEAIKLVADQDKLVSDETKRSSSKINQDYLGMPGSFRKLNVD